MQRTIPPPGSTAERIRPGRRAAPVERSAEGRGTRVHRARGLGWVDLAEAVEGRVRSRQRARVRTAELPVAAVVVVVRARTGSRPGLVVGVLPVGFGSSASGRGGGDDGGR